MTDNEIIKALEVHTTSGVFCDECPIKAKRYAMVGSPCVTLLIGEAKDLINRQKAEIERKRERVVDLLCQVEEHKIINESQNAEIERLQYANKVTIASCGTLHEMLKTAKAEAIKEFTERVENKLNLIPQHHFTLAQVLFELGKTKKEMVGDV